MMFTTAVVLLACIAGALAFPGGAPASVCDTLMPGHGPAGPAPTTSLPTIWTFLLSKSLTPLWITSLWITPRWITPLWITPLTSQQSSQLQLDYTMCLDTHTLVSSVVTVAHL